MTIGLCSNFWYRGRAGGLSWSTILNKRLGYREAFDFFDPEKVARYGEKKISELLDNPRIVRNRLKIRSAVSNAQAFLKVQQGEFFRLHLVLRRRRSDSNCGTPSTRSRL